MKTLLCKSLLYFLFFAQNASVAQQTNSVELIELTAIKNSDVKPVTKKISDPKITAVQPGQLSVTDSTSVYMIVPKQYDAGTMDSKPQ